MTKEEDLPICTYCQKIIVNRPWFTVENQKDVNHGMRDCLARSPVFIEGNLSFCSIECLQDYLNNREKFLEKLEEIGFKFSYNILY